LLAIFFMARQIVFPKVVEKGFARQVSENIGVDRTAELTDGLHVYICGAGHLYQTQNAAARA